MTPINSMLFRPPRSRTLADFQLPRLTLPLLRSPTRPRVLRLRLPEADFLRRRLPSFLPPPVFVTMESLHTMNELLTRLPSVWHHLFRTLPTVRSLPHSLTLRPPMSPFRLHLQNLHLDRLTLLILTARRPYSRLHP